MKILKTLSLSLALLMLFTSCRTSQTDNFETNITEISLSDKSIKVNGKSISADKSDDVYATNDIVYYKDGMSFTYGVAGANTHSAAEADEHRVIHISEAGTYEISGKLSKGQISVDLGAGAEANPDAKVTLILNNADITCTVAPAIIFYNVYECGEKNEENATKDVDTTDAGANIIIADGSTNTVSGSYVDKIYIPDSVVLNEDKTEVVEASKLHKYDGALYSKMSMNVDGGKNGDGILNVNAENEGLDSELHLTVNGGKININSGNDGINTNEDNVSVTTINGGSLNITVTGETGEGDGIDSNGWLVINGGKVTASACSDSADAGIDSDKGIHINGGTVIATGHMLDRIENGGQNYAVFNFEEKQKGNNIITLRNDKSKDVLSFSSENDFSVLIYSSPDLAEGNYTLYNGNVQLKGQSSNMAAFPERKEPPEMYEGVKPPERGDRPEGAKPPEGMMPPEGFESPEGMEPQVGTESPEGFGKPAGTTPHENTDNTAFSTEFRIINGSNMFSRITTA